MNRRLASLLLAALVAVPTGCSDDEPDPNPIRTPTPTDPTPTAPTADIRFETISDAAFVGGEQSTAITATSALGVVRVELFLDTMRIGAAEFAPFDIAWTTLDFAEGGHTLTARAHLGDGSYVDRSHSITVDNTPPSVGGLWRNVERGQVVELPVYDAFGIAHVVVTGATYRDLYQAPFQITAELGCGRASLQLTVTDRAGWTATGGIDLEVTDPADRDCDAWSSPAVGGTDCNDDNANIHPGRYDDGSSQLDVNCDGVPGTDADHDGVASLDSGGADCNDYVTSVFGPVVTWRELGVPWSSVDHGPRVARAAIGNRGLHLVPYVARTVSHVAYDDHGGNRIDRTIASNVDAVGDLFVDGGALVVVYARSGALYLATWSGNAWSSEVIYSTFTGTLVSSDIDRDRDGLVVAVTGSAGTALIRKTATGWSQQTSLTPALSSVVVDGNRRLIAGTGVGAVYRIDYSASVPAVVSYPVSVAGQPAIVDGAVLYNAREFSWSYEYLHRDGIAQTYTGTLAGLERASLPYRDELAYQHGSSNQFWTSSGELVWFSAIGYVSQLGASRGVDLVYAHGGSTLVTVDTARAPAAETPNDGVDSDCDGSYTD